MTIYAYDSFVSSEGLGPKILPLFEKSHGCHVKVLGVGDGGQLLARVQLDEKRKKASADVVVGIDQIQWERIKSKTRKWEKWEPQGYSELEEMTRLEKGFLPYDYGALAWIANQKILDRQGLKAPTRFSDLLKPEWKRNLILEDPRTSTPGLIFLFFTQEVLGGQQWPFWSHFKTQWLTLTPGWDDAYALFLKDEAPLVWSYLTSQAYHEEKGQTQYRAVLLDEGQPYQIEGAALIQDTPLAKKFLEFLISPDVQKLIPTTNWMLPSRNGIALPESFRHLPKPKKWTLKRFSSSSIESSLSRWSQTIEQ